MLDLEREALLSLCGEKKWQERVRHIRKAWNPFRKLESKTTTDQSDTSKALNDYMTADGIDYRGTVSRELFLRAQNLHAGSVRLSLSLVLVFIGLAFIGMSVLGGAPVGVFFAGVLTAVLVPLFLCIRRWQWQRLYKRSPYLLEAIEGLVSQQGLRVRSSLGTGDYPWTLFTKYRETGDLILLYLAPNMFSIVAKDLFGGEGDWQRARDLVRERVKRG